MIVNKTRVTFSTNGNPNQNQSCFRFTRLPALGASYMYLLRIVIGSLCCLHLSRLARVITLVLVLRPSIGNRSITRDLTSPIYTCCRSYLAKHQHPDSCIKTSVLHKPIRDKSSENHAQTSADKGNPAHVFTHIRIRVILVKVRLRIICPHIPSSISYRASKKQDDQ